MGNWVELNDFWLSETLRGQGLGSSLLAQIEQIGKGVWGEHGQAAMGITIGAGTQARRAGLLRVTYDRG